MELIWFIERVEGVRNLRDQCFTSVVVIAAAPLNSLMHDSKTYSQMPIVMKIFTSRKAYE